MSSYATDGRCHNAQPGTYGHECGKPAAWVGTNASGFSSGFCDDCRQHGFEARDMISWAPFGQPSPLLANLRHAVTRYDRRQCGKRGYNFNALGLYLGRAEEAASRVAAGEDLQAVLADCFNDRLLDFVRRYLDTVAAAPAL